MEGRALHRFESEGCDASRELSLVNRLSPELRKVDPKSETGDIFGQKEQNQASGRIIK
jgi:hypothetical protein